MNFFRWIIRKTLKFFFTHILKLLTIKRTLKATWGELTKTLSVSKSTIQKSNPWFGIFLEQHNRLWQVKHQQMDKNFHKSSCGFSAVFSLSALRCFRCPFYNEADVTLHSFCSIWVLLSYLLYGCFIIFFMQHYSCTRKHLTGLVIR